MRTGTGDEPVSVFLSLVDKDNLGATNMFEPGSPL